MGWKSFGVIILGALLMVACSSSATPTPVPTTTSAPPTATSPAPATSENSSSANSPASPPDAAPSRMAMVEGIDAPQGGKLVQLYGTDPPTLDPHLTTDSASGRFVNEIFGGLVTIDLDYETVPDLAERWDVSSDGKVYTFHLRPDAKFHDGKPVTAQDVKWSLERVSDPAIQSPVAQLYLSDIVGVPEKLRGEANSVEGVRVIDDRTIEITIDAAKAYFLSKLTYPTAFILDRENVEGNPDWLRQPNGTGPFKLAQYDVGEVIRLARNENYHLGPPHLDEVEFILSGGSSMIMYENNEIHLTGVGLADLERVRDPNSPLNAQLERAPADFSVSFIAMNVSEPPFDDPKVRQALNLAINKEAIATQVLENLVRPANGIIPPEFPSYNPDLRGYEYNPERARQLLQESKYGDNLDNLPRITLNIEGGFGASVPLYLEVILQSWEDELGITAEIQQTEWATFLQDVHARRYQMFSLAWSADYPDPENFLDVLFHSKSENDWTTYHNPEVDALLEQARVEQDQEKRFELYNRIEQMIIDDAPWIPLWHSGESYALIKPEVKNYFLTAMTIPKYRYVYMEPD